MDKTMKLGLLLLVFAMLIAAVSSASRQLQPDPAHAAKSVALIVRSPYGDYWKTVKMGAEAAAKEFQVELAFAAPENEADIQGQISLVDKALKEGAGAIVLAASDFNRLAVGVERAAGLKVPVIAIDSEINSPKAKSFIGPNNYEAGKLAGKKVVELAGQNSRLAIVSFLQGERNAEQREQGLLDEISAYPGVKVAEKAYSLSNRERARELTGEMIRRTPDIDAIVALNELSSVGAADEIQRRGLQGRIKLITFDSTSEELELLQEGVIQATIIQNPFSMGYLGVKHAVEAMEGRSVPQRIETSIKAIDLENMFWLDNQKLLFPFVK